MPGADDLVHRRPDLPRGARHLRRRRQVVVDRHAALQLPVHRPAVLQDHRRQARRHAARRRLPGDHHRLLGLHGGGRRAGHLGAARRVQLRQGPARPGRGGQPRLPDVALPRASTSSTPSTRQATDDHPLRPHPPAAGRARARDLDRRRLHRHRPRRHQRQPALGQQHADHQRRDDRGHRSPWSASPRSSGGTATGRCPGSAIDAPSRSPRSWQAADAAARAGLARPRTPPSSSRTPPRPTGTTSRRRPTSASTTPSRPHSARRSARPPREDRLLYGFVNHEVATTYLGSSRGLRLRHVQPTGHYACTGKDTSLTRSAWTGGATRDFRDVDAAAMAATVAQRLAWAERRIDLPAGRYDTILPPSSVADLMIDAYWGAGARVAHEGESVYSRRGGGTRIGDKVAAPGRQPVLRPGPPRPRVRAVRDRRRVRQHRLGLRQRSRPRAHRLDPRRPAHRAAPDPPLGRHDRPAGHADDRQPRPRGRRRRRHASTTWSPARSAGCC